MASVVSRIIEVCIFRFTGNAIEYLLLKRAANDALYPGIWQWVTGSVKEGESSLLAARRELKEETGFTGERVWIVPHVSTFYDPVHDRVHLSPLFAVQVETDIDPALSPEHDEFRWVSFEEARRRLVWPGQREGLGLVNSYILGGEEGAKLVEIGQK